DSSWPHTFFWEQRAWQISDPTRKRLRTIIVAGLASIATAVALVLSAKRMPPHTSTAGDWSANGPKTVANRTARMWLDESKLKLVSAKALQPTNPANFQNFQDTLRQAEAATHKAISVAREHRGLSAQERGKLELEALLQLATSASMAGDMERSQRTMSQAVELSKQCNKNDQLAHLQVLGFQADTFLQSSKPKEALQLSRYIYTHSAQAFGDGIDHNKGLSLRRLIDALGANGLYGEAILYSR